MYYILLHQISFFLLIFMDHRASFIGSFVVSLTYTACFHGIVPQYATSFYCLDT